MTTMASIVFYYCYQSIAFLSFFKFLSDAYDQSPADLTKSKSQQLVYPPPSKSQYLVAQAALQSEVFKNACKSFNVERMSHVLCPSGDAVLVIGKDPSTEVTVNSGLLKLASPVLKAMLEARFQEEETQLESSGRVTINLPDDDTLAMIWILKEIHYHEDLNLHPSLDFLGKIFVVYDKYAFRGYVSKHLAVLLFEVTNRSPITVGNLKRYIQIAIILKDRELLWESTSRLLSILVDTAQNEDGTHAGAGQDLADQIYDAIVSHVKSTKQSIQSDLDKIVSNALTTYANNKLINTMAVGNFYLKLSRIGLFPIAEAIKDLSIEQLLEKLRKYADCGEMDDYAIDIADGTIFDRNFVYEEEYDLYGLCLTCAKAGKLDPGNGNCMGFKRCGNTVVKDRARKRKRGM